MSTAAAATPGRGLIHGLYGMLGRQARKHARHAIAMARLALQLSIIPLILLCLVVAVLVLLSTLAMPTTLRWAYGVLAVLIAGGSVITALHLLWRGVKELSEDVRFLVRESEALSSQVQSLLRRRFPKLMGSGEQQLAPGGKEELKLSWSTFMRVLRFVSKAANTAEEIVLAPMFDFGRAPLWLSILGSLLLAWSPLWLVRWLDPGGEWTVRALQSTASLMLCAPPAALLIFVFLARRWATYIGVAEALLDEPE